MCRKASPETALFELRFVKITSMNWDIIRLKFLFISEQNKILLNTGILYPGEIGICKKLFTTPKAGNFVIARGLVYHADETSNISGTPLQMPMYKSGNFHTVMSTFIHFLLHHR